MDEYDAIQAQIERANETRRKWQAGISIKSMLLFAAPFLVLAGVVMWMS